MDDLSSFPNPSSRDLLNISMRWMTQGEEEDVDHGGVGWGRHRQCGAPTSLQSFIRVNHHGDAVMALTLGLSHK